MRSAGAFLGLPWNLCNLALVTTLLAQQTGYLPGEIVWFGLDVHLYENHLDQARLQLVRSPRPWPSLRVRCHRPDLFAYRIEDLELLGYDPHPSITAPVAV